MKLTNKRLIILSALLLPAAAMAHETGHMEGVIAGLLHPFTGADHLLVLVGCALIASRFGSSARYLLPLGFVSMLLLGAVAALNGGLYLAMESAIAISLVLTCTLLVLQRSLPKMLIGLALGVTALALGQAHATAMSAAMHTSELIVGLALSSIALQLLVVGLAGRFRNRQVPAVTLKN